MQKSSVALFLLVAIFVPQAAAHPFTLETHPGNESGQVGITQVWVRYSEEVVVEFSSLKIYDSAGHQIDNRDTTYHTDERTLVVSTPPLEDGIYTISSRVLSAVDGHLVPDTRIFAVGSAIIDTTLIQSNTGELLALPEAGAAFPGLVGQSIVAGSALAALLVWRHRPNQDRDAQSDVTHHNRLQGLTGMALLAVFASNILMLVVQTIRLEAFSVEIFQTVYGTVWLIRMGVTVAMLCLWFVAERGHRRGLWHVLLVLSLILLWTSSQTGHGAATGEPLPLILDFIHNIVAAAWIGGILYLYMVVLPSLAGHPHRDGITLRLIPRFSVLFVAGLGIVIVTGPLLMWSLDDDIDRITNSLYGQLIVVKISLAMAMAGMGGYVQWTLIRRARHAVATSGSYSHITGVYRTLKSSLRYEAVLGMSLLVVVAVLINGTLPAGYDTTSIYSAQEDTGQKLIAYSANTRFDVTIQPYTTGINGIYITTHNLDGTSVEEETGIGIKISNPDRNITPVSVDTTPEEGEYQGEAVFGFAGRWLLEIESQRQGVANEVISILLPVKPDLDSMLVDITEYELPLQAAPLQAIYDDTRGVLWISDAAAPRVWSINTETGEFDHVRFAGNLSLFLDIDPEGRVWFSDPLGDQIGYIDDVGHATTIPIPVIEPENLQNSLISTMVDDSGRVWAAVANKDTILRYDPDTDTFDLFHIRLESFPFALAQGTDGRVWFTANGGGFIGYVADEDVHLIIPDEPLASPEALLIDEETIWISEHTGGALVRFDTIQETFERIPLGVPEGLPYGSVHDKYGNIWVAQHTVDIISIYDPLKGTVRNVEVPTQGSFVQFITTDGNGDVWFVEQQSNKIARATLTDVPSTTAPPRIVESAIVYSEVAAPLMAIGVLASAIFFAKGMRDRRILDGAAH